ncbi:MAG: ribosome assembly RNA-binding protein YhbY [Gammaproteobacteria bacterium]|nr:ribosome assembly RNA-binding protein YhbY [Gammaproteobacteria bacterium]NND58668.1 ribosome assembly RNA-binding protein YhbY [Gammaproteobacteria bacterium]
MLKENQKKFLRGRGHDLKPVVLVGNAGLTAAVIREINGALTAHELIKVKLRVGDRDERDIAIATLLEQSGAELVQRVGNTALLFRRNDEKPRIELPRA